MFGTSLCSKGDGSNMGRIQHGMDPAPLPPAVCGAGGPRKSPQNGASPQKAPHMWVLSYFHLQKLKQSLSPHGTAEYPTKAPTEAVSQPLPSPTSGSSTGWAHLTPDTSHRILGTSQSQSTQAQSQKPPGLVCATQGFVPPAPPPNCMWDSLMGTASSGTARGRTCTHQPIPTPHNRGPGTVHGADSLLEMSPHHQLAGGLAEQHDLLHGVGSLQHLQASPMSPLQKWKRQPNLQAWAKANRLLKEVGRIGLPGQHSQREEEGSSLTWLSPGVTTSTAHPVPSCLHNSGHQPPKIFQLFGSCWGSLEAQVPPSTILPLASSGYSPAPSPALLLSHPLPLPGGCGSG